ncbi:hypothetical protein [Streptomyces gardneri]|uniref:Uncharacterized protein n=1 Tax=Streptomyces gardneri TaxID=66892 RepID=A0A4Y3RLY0_9ACTN|nr:hypothetical protein [Streptomyces gardneri]GEB57723.1 hypothetical protein SGA01_33280 [Streptomyces gardneri]GHH02828.1 hypothetical protein GCM10017674_39920 [Streptomyces gardneri]
MAGTNGRGEGESQNNTTLGSNSPVIGRVGNNAAFHFLQRHRLLETLPLLVAVGVATYSVLTWPGGPQSQYFSFYAFLVTGFVCSVAYAVRGQGRIQLALALGCTLVAFGAHASVARNGEVAVEIDVRGTQPLHGSATGALTLVMPAPAADDVRDRLRVALTISDSDPLAPTCVHRTTATLSATTAGVTPGSRRIAADSEVDLDLGGHRGEVVLSFVLHTEPNCVMRLAKVRGTLHNR